LFKKKPPQGGKEKKLMLIDEKIHGNFRSKTSRRKAAQNK